MMAAVDLHQHALLGHAPAPEAVLLGAAAARTANACLDQNCVTAVLAHDPYPAQHHHGIR